MGRRQDLLALWGLGQRSSVGYIDLTPNGALDAVGDGPPIDNTLGDGCVEVVMTEGTGTMDVRLEGSNTQAVWTELCAFTNLTGAGTSEMFDNWKRCAFLRLRVASVGTGGKVTGTQVLSVRRR